MVDLEEWGRDDRLRLLVSIWARNTEVETIHLGVVPVSRTEDLPNVRVEDADGRRIPRPKVSHFDDEATRGLMR